MSIESYSQDKIILNKDWEYKSELDSIWRTCSIPSSIYNLLLSDKLISDPFYSNNEDSLQHIGRQKYQFRTHFLTGSQHLLSQQQILVLNGIDTYADIYLNDKKLIQCNSAFRTWEIDVLPFLVHGKNELLIDFHSTESIAKNLYNKLNPSLPGGERVMVRKPQYHFGWDFGPKYTGCGIMDIPYVRFYSDFNLLHSSVHTTKLFAQYAEIELVLEMQSATDNSYLIQWSLDNHLYVNTLQCKKGQNIYRFKQKIRNPKLWWPNGSGEAYLYDTRLQIAHKDKKIVYLNHFNSGIRTIKLINKKDKWGSSFYFQVNGINVFAKGANYIPQSIFQDRTQNHEEILRDAYHSNFNMLRIWGGGNYESGSFYEYCDRLGIMIWQDFMYACAMYPGDSVFMDNARREADEQVKRLSRFACIALWCGNNENNEAWNRWGWQIGLSSDTKERFWSDYQKLFNQILPESVASYSNQSSYWESSPLYGRGDSRFNSEGDAHDWGIWHDEMKFEAFEQRVPRFMSEAGFQSLPSIYTIKSFTPADQLSLESSSLLSHQKHPRGNKLIQDYLLRDLPQAKDFESLIYLNQLNQAEGIGIGIKAHRRAKPYCMGTLYWQFNDCWPGLSWSSRDYYGRWKALQHKVKELYQDILLTTRESGSVYEIFASSDLPRNTLLNVQIKFIGNSNKELINENIQLNLNANYSGRIFAIDLNKYKKQYDPKTAVIYIQWEYKDQKSYSIHFLDKLKELKLPQPSIKILNLIKTPVGYEFDLISDQFAKAVYLREGMELQFFPNFIDLAPNRAIKISCKTKYEIPTSDLIQFVSLYDFLK